MKIIWFGSAKRSVFGFAGMSSESCRATTIGYRAALPRSHRRVRSANGARPVVVDAWDFYYPRISMAMGDDIVLEILDREGIWQYVNDYFAAMNNHKRVWFVGKSLFEQFPQLGEEWRDIVRTVADTRETYIDRRGFQGASHLPTQSPHWTWNVLIFPIKLHDDRDGVVLTARLIEKK